MRAYRLLLVGAQRTFWTKGTGRRGCLMRVGSRGCSILTLHGSLQSSHKGSAPGIVWIEGFESSLTN